MSFKIGDIVLFRDFHNPYELMDINSRIGYRLERVDRTGLGFWTNDFDKIKIDIQEMRNKKIDLCLK